MEKRIKFPIAGVVLLVCAIIKLILHIPGISSSVTLGFSFVVLVEIALYLYLGIVLVAKKRNILLLSAVCGLVILKLVNLVQFVSIYNALAFGSMILLLVIATVLGEQKLINVNSEKTLSLCKRFFFVPSALLIVNELLYLAQYGVNWAEELPFLIILNIYLSTVVEIVSSFLIAQWLTNPYSKQKNTSISSDAVSSEVEEQGDEGIDEAYCNLGKHIVLCLFTFGIWSLIWIYRTTKYLNKVKNVEYYNPTNKLLLCMFVPFYQIYWLYKHGQRIDMLSKEKNLNNSDMATLCLVLGIFIPIVACILMQDRINTICTTKTIKVEESKSTNFDEITKYKGLLDNGIITQEEFDEKKKQLLGL